MEAKTIWIDLDNSPHVPFFRPVMAELEARGYSIVLTARDCYQVCDLADLFGLDYRRVGRHYGGNRLLKVSGVFVRALQLLRTVLNERPALAVSHGSRSQVVAAKLLGVPSVSIDDYEYSREIVDPTWMIMPEVIPEKFVKKAKNRVFRYPGIKEDVYVPSFQPDSKVREVLGVGPMEVVVTIRPPATEAHYHNVQSERMFEACVDFVVSEEGTRIVMLPRSNGQRGWIERRWRRAVTEGRILMPQKAMDGLSVIWSSDLVISGGGTMNREAAALGVPVYSVFRGRIGAVDEYLSAAGRLTLLESVEDIRRRLLLVRRVVAEGVRTVNSAALESIVEIIDRIGMGRVCQE